MTYYSENKEKVKEYYLRNKEKILAQQKKHRENNPEYHKERKKKWVKENPEKVKDYYLRNKERIKSNVKKWNKENPEKIKEYALKHTYGITLKDKDNMIKVQDGKCANPLCDTKFSEIPEKQIHIDHDHESGKVRGILCNVCNILEGFVNKNAKRIFGIIEYKRLHELKG